MTDKEIIKALEVCGKDRHCTNCPLYKVQKEDGLGCIRNLKIYALDLINRQQTEVEEMHKRVMRLDSEREEWSRSAITEKLKNIELQAEIERLKAENEKAKTYLANCFDKYEKTKIAKDSLENTLYTARAEVIKEFVEKFDSAIDEIKFPLLDVVDKTLLIAKQLAHKIAKEMVGEQE
jgi:hypothetical protein